MARPSAVTAIATMSAPWAAVRTGCGDSLARRACPERSRGSGAPGSPQLTARRSRQRGRGRGCGRFVLRVAVVLRSTPHAETANQSQNRMSRAQRIVRCEKSPRVVSRFPYRWKFARPRRFPRNFG
jgi:hypothetical protein